MAEVKIKGRATKVYSVNREKLEEVIKILDNVSGKFKSMLKRTEVKDNHFKKAVKEIRDVRISREREENERKYDEWFKNLSMFHKSFIAYDFWVNASYEEKKKEYDSN